MWCVHTDGLEELVLIVAMEGGLTNEHLIEKDAEGPPVHREGVLLALQDLEQEKAAGAERARAPARLGLLCFWLGHGWHCFGEPFLAPPSKKGV